jgi:2-keto-3-deoxy-L-rhamnonate aldolase RhmA
MRESLRSGEAVVGTWVSLAEPAVAELLAPDFEFVVLDTEHTPNTLETVANCARAVDAAPGEALPIARVAWNDPVRTKRILDLGLGGVMVPMVETPDEAEAAVAACRYPPEGIRGMAAARAHDYGRSFDEYVERANDDVLTILQVETEEGLSNVEEIAAVDGVDALFVGPADLSANLGVLGEWESDAFVDGVERIVTAAQDAGTPVGTLGVDVDQLRAFDSFDYDYVIAGVDAAMLLGGAADVRAAGDEML